MDTIMASEAKQGKITEVMLGYACGRSRQEIFIVAGSWISISDHAELPELQPLVLVSRVCT
jgi:hypothetical protein